MKRLWNLLEFVVRLWAEWTFRRRSIGMALVNAGLTFIGVLIAGFAINFALPTSEGVVRFSFSSDAGLGSGVTLGLIGVGVVLILFGVWRIQKEWGLADRRRVVAIELRGLRDWSGPPLMDGIPQSIEGRREPIAIDLRQGVNDGEIVSPEAALGRLHALRSRVETIENGLDRRDISYVVGGLGSVPFTFLLGVLVDDEIPITIMDWYRDGLRWRELDEPDDGKRFAVIGLDQARGARVIAVAISSSYTVETDAIRAKLSNVPVVRLDLDGRSTNSHWSTAKQAALAAQFRETILELANTGAKQIHLFFAGPSSLVLRFGMTYDKRNLPALTVYQFDQSVSPPFPWAIEMPVAGKQAASVAR